MSTLYCNKHGQELLEKIRAANSATDESAARIKIVIGALRGGATAGGLRCNTCNRPLKQGETGVYIYYYNRDWPDENTVVWEYIDAKNVISVETFVDGDE